MSFIARPVRAIFVSATNHCAVMEYNHFTYCEQLARHLKEIAHTDARPRYFTAFGLEDLYNFEDRLSGVTGTVMIAVDGQENESADNGADALSDNDTYSIIIARNTQRDRPKTVDEAVASCKLLAKQVRNFLLADPDLTYQIDRNTAINGIGPIGDGFYGVVLSYRIVSYNSFYVEPEYWIE